MSIGQIFQAPAVSLGPVAITYQATYNDLTNRTVYTSSSHAIGTASADRIVVVSISTDMITSTTLDSVSIGGSAATKIAEAVKDGKNTPSMWYRLVTTGTTADIVATFSAGQTNCAITTWSVTGAGSAIVLTASDTDTPATGNQPTTTVAIAAGGGAISEVMHDGASTATWAGVDEDHDTNPSGLFYSGGSKIFAAADADLVVAPTLSNTTSNNIRLLTISIAPG